MRSDPEWWKQAKALELEDRLHEAEKVISKAVREQGFAIQTAELYRLRMLRLRANGDEAGAAKAREKATSWAHFFASQATSGGEGMALSLQRDEFLQTLWAKP
ncbi:MAG TPA: hypothetical protein VGL53_12205 [Bryobacteraceae bacterium]|jgi:hypothetical protein